MTIANCKQCGKIFQRTLSPLCPACHQQVSSRISNVYRFIQANPHMTIEEVAISCDVPLKEVETMLFEGKLGTAAVHLVSHCQRCNGPMLASRGHFCQRCAGLVETEAGLHEEKPKFKGLYVGPQPESTTRNASANPVDTGTYRAGGARGAVNDEPAGGRSYGFKRISES